jgi:PAS domain S-box-containing protein
MRRQPAIERADPAPNSAFVSTSNAELETLRARLEDAEETLRAIRHGEADAVVVNGPIGPRVYTLVTADQTYRTLVEQMHDAALIVSDASTILYCNTRLGALLSHPAASLAGQWFPALAVAEDRRLMAELLARGMVGDAAGEVRLQGGNGETIPVHLSLSALDVGEFRGVAVIARDLREQKQRDLAAARERLTDAVLQFAGTAILVCDAAGRIMRANELAMNIFGTGLVGRRLDQLITLAAPLPELAASGAAGEYQVGPSARPTYLLVQVRSLAEILDSEQTTWVLTLADITASKRAEASLRLSEERFRVALRNSQVVVASCDRNLRYTWIHNPHPDFEARNLIGMRDDELGPAEHVRELVRLKQDVLDSGRGLRREISVQVGTEIRHYNVSADPLIGASGEVVGAITAASDVTELRRAEQAAERANRAKGEFLAVMSHELRTPLNSVVGYADLLLMELHGPLSPMQKSHAERIKVSAHHQLALIEEILTYTRIEAGQEHFRVARVDATRLLRDAVEFVRPHAEHKRIELELNTGDAPLEVLTDAGRLRQIVLNIIANAVKFTSQGSVRVTAGFEGEQLVVRVQDTGPGIPADMRDTIFEPFTQVEASNTRENGGSGLGLAIARRLCELLGGTIELQSEAGQGSTFIISVPRRGPGEPTA